MTEQTTVARIAALLGAAEDVQDGALMINREEYVLTLCETDGFLEAELLYKTPCPRDQIEKAARILARRNHMAPIAGFFMCADGFYGQRQSYSVLEDSANIVAGLLRMAHSALSSAVYL